MYTTITLMINCSTLETNLDTKKTCDDSEQCDLVYQCECRYNKNKTADRIHTRFFVLTTYKQWTYVYIHRRLTRTQNSGTNMNQNNSLNHQESTIKI